MDMEDIHYLLGGTIFARAENYMKHIESFDCETEENGVRHLCAEIEGSGDHLYTTEAWLRQMAVSSVQAVPARITIMAMGFFVSTSVRCCCMI